ncbi:hypothetical protein LJB42_000780 [Komagataella kurtzmanii]|nr:hypothetical protein LJB42_000780 [Komagataella kurtzmanii]
MDNNVVVFTAILVVVSIAAYILLFSNSDRKVLKKDEFQPFPLIQRTQLTHNTAIFRFGLPRPTDVLGLPIGQHISIAASIGGKEVLRSYTPTSTDDAKGYFDLLIKVYEQGNITKYVDNLKLGESIRVRGPKGNFTYTPNMVKELNMIAGGTGITPMYQIITAIARNPEDKTRVNLIYGNQKEEDILLREELESISVLNPNIKIFQTLDTPPANWEGGVGFVTEEMMRTVLSEANDSNKLLICGPPPMVSSCKKNAVLLGYPKAKPVTKLADQVFVF